MFHEPRFWTALAFVLFFVIFGRKLWRVMAEHLDARAADIRESLDEAARLRREAEQMLEDATREREQALEDAKALIAASEAEAAALMEQAKRDSEEATLRHEKMARDRIQAAEQTALRDIRERATALAIAAAREAMVEQLSQDPDLSAKLLASGIDSLPKALRNEAA